MRSPRRRASLRAHDRARSLSHPQPESQQFKDHHIAGEIYVDLAFSYGLYGFGYSPQLMAVDDDDENFDLDHDGKDPEVKKKAQANVSNSLLPRAYRSPPRMLLARDTLLPLHRDPLSRIL